MELNNVRAVPSQAPREAGTEQCAGDGLTGLGLEVTSSLRLPELAEAVTRRAAEMLGGTGAILALVRGQALETVCLFRSAVPPGDGFLRRLNLALSDFALRDGEAVRYVKAADCIGLTLAASLDWDDVTTVLLRGSDEKPIGVLLIANRGHELTASESDLLKSLARHASVALYNSRLFSRMAQSNAQWVETFDAISDFIVVHDQAARVLRVNRRMAEFIGLPPADVIGLTMRSLIGAVQLPCPEPCLFCREGDQRGEDLHTVKERTYLVSTSRVHATLDESTQTVHVLKDVTDRREAERRYRELFDNIQEGLFFSTPEGRFVEVNDALVCMLGYPTREELLAVDIPTQLFLNPARYGEFRQAMQNGGILRNHEEALRHRNGSLVHTLQNVFVVRNAAGRIIQYRGLMLDISPLKAFQSELQRQRDFNAKILENTQSLILVVDTAGLVSYANSRCYEVGGFDPGQLVGRRLEDLVQPKDRQKFREAMGHTLKSLQADNLELTLALAGGRNASFSANLSPMRDEHGQVNSIIVVMSDITDALSLQSKLMRTEKMAAVGQLVSGVAHEVNNPLTAIMGFAELLGEQSDVPESARAELQIIMDEAQRAKTIIQNLLSFARQMPHQRKPLAINDLVRRTMQLHAYGFANTGVTVREQLQEPFPEIVGDPQQLQQVFLNILNNAYDAIRETAKSGAIEIETAVRNGSAEITFTDDGPGIREPDRIFDPFYTTKEVGKGTGLGLSICYGIVREHGGEIIGQNRANGPGATFIVRIPLDQKTAASDKELE